MLHLSNAGFAMVGVAVATGPLIIHLLNRRRYRVVEWAAMDFLKQALQRNRRILQLRDLLLLLLRTACLLLFGFAMARPYLAQQQGTLNSDEPVHAVLLIDNSLSMSYERLDKTLLDEVKLKATEFIERLPQGSRVTIIPVCGSASNISRDAYRTAEDARDALQRIEVVDRMATATNAADLALEACQTVPELPTKRVVLVGDQQGINWPAGGLREQLQQLPELQVVHVAPEEVENSWVAEFQVQAGVADVESPATFIVTVQHEGPHTRRDVKVSLVVEGVEVATQSVDLEPGQRRQLEFRHQFDIPVEQGKTHIVPVSVSMTQDRLPGDDQRFLAVPVVSALPVAFIDQYGAGENRQKNQFGETYRLRSLLAPVNSRSNENRQLLRVQQLTIDQVSRESLQDVRMVIMAGVESPGQATQVLREYVQQGGPLFIAAGAGFDPGAWTREGWLDGRGILPLPLQSQPVGHLPEEVQQLKPFFLSPTSMLREYFYVGTESPTEIDSWFADPLFFKAIAADTSPETLATIKKGEIARIEEEQAFLKAAEERRLKREQLAAKGPLSADEEEEARRDEERRQEIEPTWLSWRNERPAVSLGTELSAEKLAAWNAPRVLGAYSNQVPFLIERRIGKGEVVFVSTGVHSPWNSIVSMNSSHIWLFDKPLRDMLARTLPQREFTTTQAITLPIASSDRQATFTLKRPDDRQETLSVDVLGNEDYALSLRNITQRGVYRVFARSTHDLPMGDKGGESAPLWERALVVNGPAEESQLTPVLKDHIDSLSKEGKLRWVERGEAIRLEGAQTSWHNFWMVPMALVWLCLLLELALLAWPEMGRKPLAGDIGPVAAVAKGVAA